MSVLLTDSPRLFAVPPVDRRNAVLLTPTHYRRWNSFEKLLPRRPYSTWQDMFDKNADRLDYLLTPGDYTTLDRMEVNHPGNTAARPKTIRYYDLSVGTVHPVQRPLSWALVDSFQFDGTSNWLVHGLTVSGPEKSTAIRGGASKITIDSCLIEQGVKYSVRIRDASDCTIQRCVIRDTIQVFNVDGEPNDSSGIQIGNVNADVLGIRILDNEIYSVGDCIQITDGPEPTRSVEVLIEGNDLYLDSSRYIDETNTTWDENAIDLKAGSCTPESTIIRNNRMWGLPPQGCTSALGEILVLNNYCRNVVVEHNIMGDAPRGMKDENWPRHPEFAVDDPRHIIFRFNQFYEIRDYSALDKGAITKPITAEITFVRNYFSRSDFIADQTPPGYRGEGPVYLLNIGVEVGDIQRHESQIPRVPYKKGINTTVAAPHGYDTYERKRWTGPEFATGAIPAAHAP